MKLPGLLFFLIIIILSSTTFVEAGNFKGFAELDPEELLDTTVISASKRKQKLFEAPNAIAVITGWSITTDNFELTERGVDFIVNTPFQIRQILQLVQESTVFKEKLRKNSI